MTDREKLIDLIVEGNIMAFGRSESFAEIIADHLIANGWMVQEWIPVTERLPEDDLTEKERMERKQIRCILSDGKRVFAGSRQRYDTNQKWH